MALTVTLALGAPSSTNVIAGQPATFIASVVNNGTANVTLNSLSAFVTGAGGPTPTGPQAPGCTIAQPNIVTPNVAPGVGNPTITTTATSYFPFSVVFNTPAFPGPTPQNAPNIAGAVVISQPAFPAGSGYIVQVTGNTSDGSVFSGSMFVNPISELKAIPAEGGAFQFTQGGNIASLLFLGAL